jgi:hypothetical protein
MLVLRIRLDEHGVAFPSMRLWAKEARMSVNYLRRHIAFAVENGWLAIEQEVLGGKAYARKLNCYLATVPAGIKLHAKDEELAEQADAACITQRDTASSLNGASCVMHGDTDSLSCVTQDDTRSCAIAPVSAHSIEGTPENLRSVSRRPPSLCHETPKSVSPNGLSVSHRVIRKSSSEVLEVSNSEEGAALSRTTATLETLDRKPSEPEEARVAKAIKMLKADPTYPTGTLARMFELSEEQIQSVRRSA